MSGPAQRTSRRRPASGHLPAVAACGLGIILLGACTTIQRPIGAELTQTCEDPRPEVCTMQYAPVCAYLEKSSSGNPVRKQYSNACSACADRVVTGYISGPCPGSER